MSLMLVLGMLTAGLMQAGAETAADCSQIFNNLPGPLPNGTVNYYVAEARRSADNSVVSVYLKVMKYEGQLDVYEGNTLAESNYAIDRSENFEASSAFTYASGAETWSIQLRQNAGTYSNIRSIYPLSAPVSATHIWNAEDDASGYKEVSGQTVVQYELSDGSAAMDFWVKKVRTSSGEALLQISTDYLYGYWIDNSIVTDGKSISAYLQPATSSSPEQWFIIVTGYNQKGSGGMPADYTIKEVDINSAQAWSSDVASSAAAHDPGNSQIEPANNDPVTVTYSLILEGMVSDNPTHDCILSIEKTMMGDSVTKLVVEGKQDGNKIFTTVTGAVCGGITQSADPSGNRVVFGNDSNITLNNIINTAGGVTVNFNIGVNNGSASAVIQLTSSGRVLYSFSNLPAATFVTDPEGEETIIEVKEYCVTASQEAGTDTVIVSDLLPYVQIYDYQSLMKFASRVNNGEMDLSAKLLCDIDASASNPDSDLYDANYTAWTPIGKDEEHSYFGTFDGDGHIITGLTYNSSADYAGLFGYVGTKTEGGVTTKGTVKNVGLVGGKITGNDSVGGVVGYNIGGTVTNCYNTGSVTAHGSDADAGGVVGYNIGGTVTNCYNTGSVTAQGGDADVGGVVGENIQNSSVENCYNTGSVTAQGSDADAGGVVGNNFYNSTVENCYYDSDRAPGIPAIGREASATHSNVTGLTTAQMTGANALDNMTFAYEAGEESPWLVKENTCLNDFYPHLAGFNLDDSEAQIPAENIDAVNWPPKTDTGTGEHKYGDTGNDRFTCSVCGQEDTVLKAAVELSDAKEAAKADLDAYKSFDDYRPDQQVELEDAINEGKVHIDGALDTNAVASALADAKAAIDTIKTDAQLTAEELDAAKTDAKRELNEYRDAADYRPEQQKELANAISVGEYYIDAAADTIGVESALRDAKAAIDAIKTDAQLTAEELDAAKTDAKRELNEYKDAADYRPAQQTELADAISAGKDAIDNANDTDAVASALADAEAAIDTIKTDAQLTAEEQLAADKAAFEAYKEEKKNAIDAMAQEGNSDESKVLIDEAKKEIDALEYDESKSLEENKEAADTVVNGLTDGLEDHRKEYTATFTADGKTVEEIKFTIDTGSIEAPPVPAKEGYEGKWTEYTLAAADITVKAVYTPTEYTATFVDEDGKTVKEVKFTVETEKLDEPGVPEKEDYTGEWEEYTIGAKDMTIKPVYIAIPAEETAETFSVSGNRSSTLGYKENQTFTADNADLPEGAEIHWFVNGEDVGTGIEYTVVGPKDDYTIQAKVIDKDGNVLSEGAEQSVKVKHGFLDKILFFFAYLLKLLMTPFWELEGAA